MRSLVLFNTLIAAVLAIATAGCIRREITYTIKKDGSCTVHFHAIGDEEDLSAGDALPKGPPWQVKQYTRETDKGKIEHHYEAMATFKQVNDIPPFFAPPNDKFAATYLQAPVEFKMTTDDHGKGYEFRQTYKARRWAQYQDVLTEIMGADLQQLLKRYKFEQLTDEEQRKVVEAYARWQLRLIDDRTALAITKTAAEKKLDAKKVQQTLQKISEYLDGLITPDYVKSRMALKDEERAKAFEDTLAKARSEVNKLILAGLGLTQDSPVFARIQEIVAYEEKEYEVSGDLGDESFVVIVHMPGTIAETNSTNANANSATWEFKGTSLYDKDYVIYVKSKLSE